MSQRYLAWPVRRHPYLGVRRQQRHQRTDALGVASGQAHHTEQCEKTRYRRGDVVRRSRNAQADQAQQALRGAIRTTGLEGCRVGVLTPDAVELGENPVIEDVEEGLQRFVPLATLGDVVQIGGGQR
ncbi:hypothetical protein D3C76_1504360 [compost metagenome]